MERVREKKRKTGSFVHRTTAELVPNRCGEKTGEERNKREKKGEMNAREKWSGGYEMERIVKKKITWLNFRKGRRKGKGQ